MIYILYTILIVLSHVLTFYLTRRHYYRPSAPLPAQTSTAPIVIPSDATADLETAQDDINKIVNALDETTKQEKKSDKPKSWMSMNS